MKATLIEIVHDAPDPRWYARYPGLRLWARRGYYAGALRWHVLPGQELFGTYALSGRMWVDLEHAWQVREGDVELRLIEIPDAGPAS